MTLRVVVGENGARRPYADEMAGQSTARALASPQLRRRCRAPAMRRFDIRAFRTDLSSRGVLGVGGKQVSETEQAALDEIASILQVD
jgi:hypothetical protein